VLYVHFHKNLPASGVRNVPSNIESSIQVQSLGFLAMPPCNIHFATLTTHQNNEETLPFIWCKGEHSAFTIRQGLEHYQVSLGRCIYAASAKNIFALSTNNCF